MTSQYNQNWGRNWFTGPAQDQHTGPHRGPAGRRAGRYAR